MSPLVAVLLFPVRPSASTAALRDSRIAFLLPLPVSALLPAYLGLKGCGAGDSLAAGGALLVLLLGLAAGGAAAAYAAGKLLGRDRAFGDRIGPCLTAAAWAALLFTLALGAAKLFRMGPEAALLAALLILVWGVMAGIALVGAEEAEGGRRLVASCLGLAGALAGFWAALLVAWGSLLMIVPAPVDTEDFRHGDPLLVRPSETGAGGELLLLKRRGTSEAILARMGRGGAPIPVGGADAGPGGAPDWDVAGRVFFRFGARGGNVVEPRHPGPR